MNQAQAKVSKPGSVGHAVIDGTLDSPTIECDLSNEIQNLHKEDAWIGRTGPSSKTLVKYADLRIVLLTMRGKMSMHEHKTAARISIQTLEGHVRLRLPDRIVELPAGQLLVLDQGIPHDVESEEDSAVLLTLSWPAGAAGKSESD